MKKLFLLVILFALAQFQTFGQYDSPKDARAYLLNNVNTVVKAGIPGPLMLSGSSAFPVMIGSVGGQVKAPFVAASYWGKGAVVAFGHGGYLDTQNLPKEDTKELILNSIRWTSGTLKPNVLVNGDEAFAQALSNLDLDVWVAKQRLTELDLSDYDVIVSGSDRLNEDEIPIIQEFVKSGGGLLTAGLGWGWMQLNKGKSLHTKMPGNILLAPMGISWANGYLEESSLTSQVDLPDFFNVSNALQFVKNYELNQTNQLEYGQALWAVMQSIPINLTAPFAIDNDFPGNISPSIPRITKTLIFDTEIPRWHSTGLYAAPGEEITITLPKTLVNKGFYVRIGAHADRNYHHNEWLRHPEVSLRFAIEKTQTTVFNPFGGLIYVEAPEQSPGGTSEVRIANAIEAPHFVLGKTNRREWITKIKNHPAPWAELEGQNLIITLQSEKIRELENPDDVIRFWDQAQENNRRLASWKDGENRPMRIVFDKQISAGYMHAGYPVMSSITNYGEQEDILDPQGDHWGFYHELGHNHQHPDWTFNGTGEVTCNLFTLYNEEFLQHKGRFIGDNQAEQKQMVNTYFERGSKFEEWKGEAFLALHMYNQLIDVYGWQALEEVIDSYTKIPNSERPKTDQEKMDLWFLTYSLNVGENLSVFFDQWGMPISLSAKNKARDLPSANLEKLVTNVKIERKPLPPGILAKFTYGHGQFIKRKTTNGSEWAEQDLEGKDTSILTQYNEDAEYFYIRKNGTSMNIRIPKQFGWTQFNSGGQTNWINLIRTIPN